jgi:hypothetical protein
VPILMSETVKILCFLLLLTLDFHCYDFESAVINYNNDLSFETSK